MRKSIVDVRSWMFDLTRHDEPPAPPVPAPPAVPPAPPAPAPTPPAPTPPVTGDPAPPAQPPASQSGFPENTPLAEMTTEQREAYWKHQARKHEERNKAIGLKDPAELDRLRQAAAELEAIKESQKTETERAVSEAEKRGRTVASQEFGVELAKAKFEAVAAGRIPDVDGMLEDLNLGKFVGADGKPNTEAITAAVNRFVALVPTPAAPPAPRPDPSQGARPPAPPTDFKTADKAEFAAELAKYGVKPRST